MNQEIKSRVEGILLSLTSDQRAIQKDTDTNNLKLARGFISRIRKSDREVLYIVSQLQKRINLTPDEQLKTLIERLQEKVRLNSRGELYHGIFETYFLFKRYSKLETELSRKCHALLNYIEDKQRRNRIKLLAFTSIVLVISGVTLAFFFYEGFSEFIRDFMSILLLMTAGTGVCFAKQYILIHKKKDPQKGVIAIPYLKGIILGMAVFVAGNIISNQLFHLDLPVLILEIQFLLVILLSVLI